MRNKSIETDIPIPSHCNNQSTVAMLKFLKDNQAHYHLYITQIICGGAVPYNKKIVSIPLYITYQSK